MLESLEDSVSVLFEFWKPASKKLSICITMFNKFELKCSTLRKKTNRSSSFFKDFKDFFSKCSPFHNCLGQFELTNQAISGYQFKVNQQNLSMWTDIQKRRILLHVPQAFILKNIIQSYCKLFILIQLEYQGYFSHNVVGMETKYSINRVQEGTTVSLVWYTMRFRDMATKKFNFFLFIYLSYQFFL